MNYYMRLDSQVVYSCLWEILLTVEGLRFHTPANETRTILFGELPRPK